MVTVSESCESPGAAETTTCSCAVEVELPSAGATRCSAGGVALARTLRVAVDWLPAASVAITAMESAPAVSATALEKLPSPASCTGAPLTVTCTACVSRATPLTTVVSAATCAPSTGAESVSEGGVTSMVNESCACALLPARSVAVTTTACAPSAETVWPLESGCPSRIAATWPGCASVAVKAIVAGVLRSSPSRAPESARAGGVRSSAKCTEALPWLPARSAALTESRWSPSAVTGVPLTNGAPSREAVTLPRCASVAEKAGVSEGPLLIWPSCTPLTVRAGGVVSWMTLTVAVVESP